MSDGQPGYPDGFGAAGDEHRVIVVGAGIAGLTAAHTLASAGVPVTVIERGAQVGGKIRTEPFAGIDLDTAADAFLARVPEAVDLCHELGLGDELVTPASRSAFLLIDGELRRFPAGLVLGVPTDLEALAASHLLSPAGVARVEADLTSGGDPLSGDTSVGQLVRSRLGDEAFEVLVEPLLSGVNAGDADHLSVRAGAPQFATAVRDQPSLIAGLRDQRRTVDPDKPVFFALRGGTSVLTSALADSVRSHGGILRLGAEATALHRHDDGWSVTTSDGTDATAPAVILATPAASAAHLLRSAEADSTMCDELGALRYASVAMIALAFDRLAVAHPLDGTGFLVSRREGLTLTACSWASSKWAHLSRSGQAIFRVSAGRFGEENALDLDDEMLVSTVVTELRDVLGISGDPTAQRVTRWDDALPQFAPGHLDRVAAWRASVHDTHPGVQLVGAAYDGLGIPACIRQGRAAAQRVESHPPR